MVAFVYWIMGGISHFLYFLTNLHVFLLKIKKQTFEKDSFLAAAINIVQMFVLAIIWGAHAGRVACLFTASNKLKKLSKCCTWQYPGSFSEPRSHLPSAQVVLPWKDTGATFSCCSYCWASWSPVPREHFFLSPFPSTSEAHFHRGVLSPRGLDYL